MEVPARRGVALLASALLASMVLAGGRAGASHGATFAVTSTVDAPDSSVGDDVCASAAGECTLRAAVMEANALADPNVISLEAPAPATYAFTIAGSGENSAGTGDLDLKQDVTIQGRGAGQDIVDAGGLDRVFHVQGAGTSATLRGLSLENGNIMNEDGGGILNTADARLEGVVVSGNLARSGGGVSSSGSLVVIGSRIADNGSFSQAGGIAVNTPPSAPSSPTVFELLDSDVRNNSATSVGGGFVAALAPPYRFEIARSSIIGNSANAGGGIWNNTTEAATFSVIRDTTIATNTVSDVNCGPRDPYGSQQQPCSAAAEGGGLTNIGALELRNVTIVLNTANKGGGGLAGGTAAISGQTRVVNSVIAKNTNGSIADNCIQALPTSLGHNLEDTANDCGFDSDPANPDATDGDRTGTDPLIGTLQASAVGYTGYYEPAPGSPLLDSGDDSLCTPEDQLTQPRPGDADGNGTSICDIGAIERYERPSECQLSGSVCGTAGDDEIAGTEGDDVLVGGPGDDHIVCGGGNDTVYSGDGNDVVECGDGDDVIYGDDGDDLLVGNGGNDTFYGGGGDDTFYGDDDEGALARAVPVVAFAFAESDGSDVINGQAGNDLAFAGGKLDRLFGGAGKDRLWGRGGNDKVKGQDGPDKLYGEDGDDELDGGKAADELRAGDGRDTCIVGDLDTVTKSCEKERRAHRRAH